MNWAELADKSYLVVPIYLCVILPLLLYVYHDILDKRWRHVADLTFYMVAYTVLYGVCGSAVIFYVVVQIAAGDYKEACASLVTILIGSFQASKLFRLARILMKHRELVDTLNGIDRTLARIAGVEPLGLHYKLLARRPGELVPEYRSRYSGEHARDDEERHLMLSTTIFDDDFPGDSVRVRWLAPKRGRIQVVDDDAEAAAARLGLWIRLVLRRPGSEPWRLATSSSPLVTGHMYRASLGTALRRLVQYGVSPGFQPPKHYERNPVEALLNRDSMTEVGVGFFWTATFMSGEEVSQALAEMHPRWVRSVTQNGKCLMWETAMSFLLTDFSEERQNEAMRHLLKLPVLSWASDIADPKVWEHIAEVCANAVVSLMPKSRLPDEQEQPGLHVRFNSSVHLDDTGEVVPLSAQRSADAGTGAYSSMELSPATIVDLNVAAVVRAGILALRDATAESFGYQGDIIGMTLLELVRASARAGFIAEEVLGPQFYTNVLGEHRPGLLCNAEIVTGLAAVLIELGLDDCEKMNAKLNSLRNKWGLDDDVKDVIQAMREYASRKGSMPLSMDSKAHAAYWLLGKVKGKCKHPELAFSALLKSGTFLSSCVHDMCEAYALSRPHVCFKLENMPHAQNMRSNWLKWKMNQVSELSRHGKVLFDNIGSQLRIRKSHDRRSSFLDEDNL